MIDRAFNLPAEIWQWLWLFIVSFTGGVVGFITKISPTLKGRSFRAKILALCMRSEERRVGKECASM